MVGPRTIFISLATALLTLSVLVGGSAASAAVVRHAPAHKISHSSSTNWSGYDVTGGTYRTVSASWVQPTVKCTSTAYSSFWVGIDGDTSGTVEQIGTDADCNGATPVYYAWYEMYPKYPVNSRNTVLPGDHFNASVSTDGRGSFTLRLTNATRGWTNTISAKLRSAKLASAEVIAEAPSSSSGVLPLANFGTVSFSGSTVNGAVLTSSTPGIQSITMKSGTTVKAQPSSISNGAFSVVWKHA